MAAENIAQTLSVSCIVFECFPPDDVIDLTPLEQLQEHNVKKTEHGMILTRSLF